MGYWRSNGRTIIIPSCYYISISSYFSILNSNTMEIGEYEMNQRKQIMVKDKAQGENWMVIRIDPDVEESDAIIQSRNLTYEAAKNIYEEYKDSHYVALVLVVEES